MNRLAKPRLPGLLIAAAVLLGLSAAGLSRASAEESQKKEAASPEVKTPEVKASEVKAEAPAPAAGAAKLAGKAACATCHTDKAEDFPKTFHGRKSLSSGKLANACESCHGSGADHAASGDPTKIMNPKKLAAGEVADLCFSCHKDKNLMFWKTSPHRQNGLNCLKCHSVHEGSGRQSLVKGKTEICLTCHAKQKADMRLASHHPIPEGKMECVSCHNPHGGILGNLKTDSVNELCAKCHAEKVGPFANEHPPVADSCTNCHAPHGSLNDRLLKQPIPYLCMGCHRKAHTGLTTAVATTPLVAQQRRNCLDCHREVHGSDRQQRFAQ